MKIFRKSGFTLTELLIAVGIIGIVAVLTVPPLISDIHTKVYLNQLKNMTASLEQLAADQMLNKRSHDLLDTDFATAGTLFTSSHFAIVHTASGLLSSNSYKTINNTTATINDIGGSSMLLKNGVVLVYKPISSQAAATDTTTAGTFIIDINGNDTPNVVGKDLFIFNITKKGKIVSGTDDNSLATCQSGDARACYGYVVNNGWKYPN